jgi:hypothetical protein
MYFENDRVLLAWIRISVGSFQEFKLCMIIDFYSILYLCTLIPLTVPTIPMYGSGDCGGVTTSFLEHSLDGCINLETYLNTGIIYIHYIYAVDEDSDPEAG